MAKRAVRNVGSMGTVLLLSLTACFAQSDEDIEEASEAEESSELARPALVSREEMQKVLPLQLGALGEARMGRLFDLGKARFLERDVEPVKIVEGEAAPEHTPSRVVSMIVGNGDHDYLWEFEPDEELSQRVSAHIDSELSAIAASMSGEAPESSLAQPKNVVGTEGRTRQGLADNVAANSWMAAVGLLTWTRTSTLISARAR